MNHEKFAVDIILASYHNQTGRYANVGASMSDVPASVSYVNNPLRRASLRSFQPPEEMDVVKCFKPKLNHLII